MHAMKDFKQFQVFSVLFFIAVKTLESRKLI